MWLCVTPVAAAKFPFPSSQTSVSQAAQPSPHCLSQPRGSWGARRGRSNAGSPMKGLGTDGEEGEGMEGNEKKGEEGIGEKKKKR